MLESDEEKRRAMEAFSEHIARGRWADARLPNRKELRATSVVAISIDSAAAKIRTGPPLDEAEDYALRVWAGVLPLNLRPGKPVGDPKLADGVHVPRYVKSYAR